MILSLGAVVGERVSVEGMLYRGEGGGGGRPGRGEIPRRELGTGLRLERVI